jgi:predicted nuclease of predicted toxin-antitoxin system
MNLYLDENIGDDQLAAMLVKASHSAVRPFEVGLAAASDPRHLKYAIEQHAVLLTKNHDDFEDLHNLVTTSGGNHPGILVVRMDNDPRRDMQPKHIVAAIGKLRRAGVSLVGQFFILNAWR